MKQVISARDIEELIRSGRGIESLPAGAVITPSARDLIRDLQSGRSRNGAAPIAAALPASNGAPKAAARPTASTPAAELEAFFNSPELTELKEQICDIGSRLWQRAYVDGNGGNISVRVADDLALCTPTLVSKGFMKPADICLVDLDGNQKLGRKRRTSEILMHLQIMKAQPKAKAVVHCHPPYATGFAVAGKEPPTCMIPEIEVFIGRVPVAPYFTPGTPEMGKHVAELVGGHNTVLMANHGAVSWSDTVEDAYFKMEILEAYCRTVVVASHLGSPLKTFSPGQLQDLLKIKQKLGIPDPRIDLKECELCDNDGWRPGVTCALPDRNDPAGGPETGAAFDPAAEQVVQAVTDEIMQRLAGN